MTTRAWRTRGIIAFAALVMLSVLATVALSASEEMVLEVKAAQNRNSIRQAYQAAYTGLDYCLYLTTLYADWRTRLGNGNWITSFAVGSGTVTVTASDPVDAQVSGDPLGTVQFSAAGACGAARRTITAQGKPQPGQAVRYVLCSLSNTDLELRQGVHVYGDIRTKGAVAADATVDPVGNIYTAAGKTVSATLIDADTQVVRTEKVVPNPPIDFTWYRGVCAELTLPAVGGHYEINRVALTPTSNPFGLANANGLYYVDGRGAEVWISDSYILGSLIVQNSTAVRVKLGCYHKAYRKYYPAIASSGAIIYEIERALKESVANVDFNGDGDTRDSFVSQVNGLIYSAGKVTGFQINADPGPFYIWGAVVANEVKITTGQSFHVYYDRDLATIAVAGFEAPGLALVAGSLKE